MVLQHRADESSPPLVAPPSTPLPDSPSPSPVAHARPPRSLRKNFRALKRIAITAFRDAGEAQARQNAAAAVIQVHMRSKWNNMRNVQKSQVALTRARYRIRARKNASQEFADKIDGAYWEQGDRSLHHVDIWEKRMLLRKHPVVMNALRRWCGVVNIPVTFATFVELNMSMFKALISEFDIDEARECAIAEWEEDIKIAAEDGKLEHHGRETLLGASVFMDVIFSVADHCEYIRGLRTSLAASPA